MSEPVNVDIKHQMESEGDVGTLLLPSIPREGEYVKKDGSRYRVTNVVYDETGVTLIVS